MFFLLLSIYFNTVLYAASAYEEEDKVRINIFERYAGSLTYGGDGRCIACEDNICNADHVYAPRSWNATLGQKSDFQSCWDYAMRVGDFGIVAFTWVFSTRECLLHVEKGEHNVSAEMVNFNGYEWNKQDWDNTGPIFRTRYPKDKYGDDSVKAVCYYGLKTNRVRNIVTEMNLFYFTIVVMTMVLWITWVRYTGTYPQWYNEKAHSGSEMSSEEEKMARNLNSFLLKKDE